MSIWFFVRKAQISERRSENDMSRSEIVLKRQNSNLNPALTLHGLET